MSLITQGNTAATGVVRVGAFNLITDGKYLQYSASTGTVSEFAASTQRPLYRYDIVAVQCVRWRIPVRR